MLNKLDVKHIRVPQMSMNALWVMEAAVQMLTAPTKTEAIPVPAIQDISEMDLTAQVNPPQ